MWLTVMDLANRFGCSRSQVYEYRKTPGFPAPLFIHRHPRWHITQIEQWEQTLLERSTT